VFAVEDDMAVPSDGAIEILIPGAAIISVLIRYVREKPLP
jgi:hypothetical protein